MERPQGPRGCVPPYRQKAAELRKAVAVAARGRTGPRDLLELETPAIAAFRAPVEILGLERRSGALGHSLSLALLRLVWPDHYLAGTAFRCF